MDVPMKSPYLLRQRKSKLEREMKHFQLQMEKYAVQDSTQGRRCYSIARRCLETRRREWRRIIVLLGGAPVSG
jgi:hypothetical protein